jgi:hypothetical protein
MRMLRLIALAPLVVASMLLVLMLSALLPPLVGLPGFLAWVVLPALLAGGLLEGPVLRVVRGARRPDRSEQAVLAPVLARLAAARVLVPDLYIDPHPGSAEPAAVLGRASLVVSTGLVDAIYRVRLSPVEAAALVARAVGRHRARPHSCDLALGAWTAPCRGVLTVAGRVGAAASWFPLLRPAWQLRFIIAIVCVVQSVAGGRTIYGLIAGGFIALTYLVPAANRAIERRVEYAADTYLLDHGLGAVLAGLLRRRGCPVPLKRLHRLTSSTNPAADGSAPQRPTLRLVHGTSATSSDAR